MKVILFDIDGTLLLSAGAGITAFNQTFLKLHKLKDVANHLKGSGKTDDIIIDELFYKALKREPSHEEHQAVKKIYIQLFPQSLLQTPNFKILPHVKTLLENLSLRKDVSLGLATGNYKETAYAKLKHAKLASYFGYGGFACDSREREGLTQKALTRALKNIQTQADDVYVVGDTPRDIECAHYISAQSIAVCTGRVSRDELLKFKPNFILNDLSEFPEI